MSEHFGGDTKQQELKKIVQELHDGAEVAKVRKRFAELIKNVSPEEIAKMEQSLITEGVPVETVQKMCDVHVAVFEESLKRQKSKKTLPGHPVRTFIDENREARRRIRRTKKAVRTAAKARRGSAGGSAKEIEEAKTLLTELKAIELHYARKENLLFPLLESAGFTGPSKVMWGKHDEIRDSFREVGSALEQNDRSGYSSGFARLARAIRRMAFMEERILFPTAIKLLSERQWAQIRRGEAEIGYAWIKPGNLWDADIVSARYAAQAAAADLGKPAPDSFESTQEQSGGKDTGETIPLDVGGMEPEIINLLLKNLPLDITYVDEHDRVRYYSQGRERIFPRTPAIIGREVRNCHPPKSVQAVEQILKDFREKKRDVAEFWLEMGEKFIHIRYFPLYDSSGAYRGVIEVSQDATALRGLKGEKRLL
jgi:DUF438 domain-containing protein